MEPVLRLFSSLTQRPGLKMNQNSPKAGSVLVKTIKTSCKTHCDILAPAQGVIYEPRANLAVLEQGSSVSPVMESRWRRRHNPFWFCWRSCSNGPTQAAHSLFPAWSESTTGSPSAFSPPGAVLRWAHEQEKVGVGGERRGAGSLGLF